MLRNLFLVLIFNSLIFCEKLFSQLSFTGVSDPWIKGRVYLFDGHQNYGRRSWALAGGLGNLNVKRDRYNLLDLRSFGLKDSVRGIGKRVRVGGSVGIMGLFPILLFRSDIKFGGVPVTNFQVEIGFKISPFREVEFAFNEIFSGFPLVNCIRGRALKVGIRFNSSGNFLTRFASFQVGPIWIPVGERFWWNRSYKLRGIYSNVDFGYSLTSKLGIGGYAAIRLGGLLRMLKRDEVSNSRGISLDLQFGFHWYF
ncbi:hypothetical protein JGI14_10612 [Candidatus Kryptonium thompsonii]|uniref:Outer membrane protein beta-barrel domain-containing protein n=1 Tax=Candidatus Kryptonium thompsonii TaxID=1633631 RepID=A0ABM9UXK2_9BACT|nr:hypothetical protein [Candidatus Kryptonium thompsoni]CUS76839.1 hypothetical protein JGI6_01998 [Candidatus Kryptonium thompsoni]CUS79368.1 hypothetical protein JGI16_10187 [Candidatus Kryptonium thompsoni]CUS85965.1 hypothetical protein JGI10_01194 [Candidatus Kryptonium thompsoni]CUS92562.1 hypothetical protein JGI14_10612 [Candidatus Kryptonium thompsoni]CUS94174.1 hypothetical protein JGI8_01938 [Candidatus Kryptonium thompsoni]